MILKEQSYLAERCRERKENHQEPMMGLFGADQSSKNLRLQCESSECSSKTLTRER